MRRPKAGELYVMCKKIEKLYILFVSGYLIANSLLAILRYELLSAFFIWPIIFLSIFILRISHIVAINIDQISIRIIWGIIYGPIVFLPLLLYKNNKLKKILIQSIVLGIHIFCGIGLYYLIMGSLFPIPD